MEDNIGLGEGVASVLLLTISALCFLGELELLATKLAVESRSMGRLVFLALGIMDPKGLSEFNRPPATFS